jgi:ADP-ribose pyrophosphatase
VTVEEELLVTSRFRVVRLEQTVHGKPHVREIVRHPGSVVIVPVVDEERICLIRNHRIAVAKTLIELPAGTLEPGEDPTECARRELIEETGFRASAISLWLRFYAAPGILDERMHIFVATGLIQGTPNREPGEEIDNLIVRWDEAIELIHRGEIEDAKTIIGLLYCRGAREREVQKSEPWL